MRQERLYFIPDHTKFGVFESLCKVQIFWNWTSQWFPFVKQNLGMIRGTEGCLFVTVTVNTGHQKSFEFERLIIMLYSYCLSKSVFRWEYLIFAITPKTSAWVPWRRKSQLSVEDLSTNWKKNVNATVGLLCKLDFVIHSVRSILKLTQRIISCFCHYIR